MSSMSDQPTTAVDLARNVRDGVAKAVEVSEKADDPAGDDFPESSCVENMLKHVDALAKAEL